MAILNRKPLHVLIAAFILMVLHALTHMIVPMLFPGNMNAPVIAAGLVVFFGYILLRYTLDK